MSNFKSTTQIFNDVYSGSSLNVYNYGSTAEVLNAVIDEANDAIRVNLIGGGGGTGTSGTSGTSGIAGTSGIDGSISGVTSDTDLYYTADVLSTPKLIISTATGAATVFQMYNTSGVLYDVTIVGSTLTATIA
jgi:hypothetical protein